MREPDEFDQFYKDVRTRLLLLTYCLTGDLSSSRAAVRDAFVVAWHHWRKVSRVEDPEAWVRVRATGRAQRRHTAKLWHREKGLDPEVKATLDALGKLSLTQRRILLTTELTNASLAEIAREAGRTRVDAERELQTATAQFALNREVPTTSIRVVLEAVRAHVEDATWPRATIIRRSGAARRRTHTVIGVAATAAALVVTGTLVTDADGVRPTLAGERAEAKGAPSGKATVEPVDVPEETMLTAESVAGAVPGKGWSVVTTNDNSGGDGLAMTCQRERYADPRAEAALVRTLEADPRTKTSPEPTMVQTSAASRTTRAAGRAYAITGAWFAGCQDDRAQLVATYDLPGVGDEASLFALHTWSDPQEVVLAGIARTGRYTTAVVSASGPVVAPKPAAVAKLLASGVDQLCELEGAGVCSTDPKPRPTTPVPVAAAPAMLDVVDLPPVKGIDQPWVGTEPRKALDNAAATTCDQTDFGSPVTHGLTRTFLIPGAKLSDEFGLTETVGTLPEAKAEAFVADIGDKLAGCSKSKKHMGTEVKRLRHVAQGGRDLSVWHVTTALTDEKSVSYLMGIVRDGTSVAQVGFVPDKTVTISEDAFVTLVERALDRVSEMPAP